METVVELTQYIDALLLVSRCLARTQVLGDTWTDHGRISFVRTPRSYPQIMYTDTHTIGFLSHENHAHATLYGLLKPDRAEAVASISATDQAMSLHPPTPERRHRRRRLNRC